MSFGRSSSGGARAPSGFGAKGALAAALGAAALAGCATSGTQPAAPVVIGQSTPPVIQPVRGKDGLTPPFMAGRPLVRVGLLLPFNARRADAESFMNAAELALFDFGDANTLLLPRDSGVTAADAERAARQLTKDGVEVILGPLLRDTVPGAAEAGRAARVPVIAFSSDRTVASDGVYLLSFALEEEVARIVRFAGARGVRSIGVIGRDDDYGRRVAAAVQAEAAALGGGVPLVRLYQRTERNPAIMAQSFAAEARAMGVQGVMIADGGAALRAVAPALLQGGLDLRRVRLLGTSEWQGPDLQREPTLAGGWFPAPDPAARANFENRYRTAYGKAPSRYASLAFDAMALAATVTRGVGPAPDARIENQQGYRGADGLYRFRGDGTIERGLAVLEVRPGGAVVVDAAPKSFPPTT